MNLLKHLQPLRNLPIFTWEYGLVSLLLATLLSRAIAAIYAALIPQKYSQLAVGDITWTLGSKQPDYLLLLLFVLSFFVIYPSLQLFATAIQQRNGSAAEQSCRQLLIYSLIPAGMWLGTIAFNSDPTLEFVIISTVLILLVLLFSGLLKSRGWQFATVQDHTACVGSSLLIVLLSIFSGIGLLLAITRLTLSWQPGTDAGTIAAAITGVLAIGGLVRAWWGRSSLPALHKKLRLLLGMAQLLLPLCFFVLLPTPWNKGTQRFYGYPLQPTLYALLGLLVLVSHIDLGRRILKPILHRRKVDSIPTVSTPIVSPFTESPFTVFSVLSPLCLAALLVFLKSPLVGAPYLVADDYHWGEFLLPWWLWQDFHAIPYQDYDPARGLVNYVPGLFANLFMNGEVASYTAVTGKPIMILPFLLIAFLGMAPAIGLLPAFLALLVMPNPGGLFEIDMMVTVGLCVLGEAFVRRRWVNWLGLGLAIAMLLLLFAPGNGGLFVISMLPVAAFVGYQAVRQERRRLVRGAIAAGMILLLLALFTPLAQILLGALRYAAEQSSQNSVAYGIEWFKSHGSQTFLTYPLWEFVRTSWIVVSVAIGLIIYQAIATREPIERNRFLVYAVPIFLITLLLIPRSAGRIDPAALSRLGNTSIWVVCLLLPIVLIKAYGRRGMALSLLVVAIAGGLLGFSADTMPSLDRAVRQPVESIGVAGLSFTDGNQVGMPVLNRSIVEPAHLQRLQKLKAVLSPLLQPGETYLDLTSSNARYFYLNYPTPIATGAVFNLVHKDQIFRAVEQLHKANPPVVLASTDINAPGNNTVALRSHLLYRYLVDRYIPVAIDPYILMIRRDRLDLVKTVIGNGSAVYRDAAPSILIGTDPALRLSLLDNVFRRNDFESIASSWGHSFGSLQSEIQPVSDRSANLQPKLQGVESLGGDRYRVTAANPRLTYDLASLNLKGRDAGLLAFDVACSKRRKAIFPIHWDTQLAQDAYLNQVSITAYNGKQLVPLDAHPRWLLADPIKALHLDPTDTACPEFSLSNLTLYQRTDVARLSALQ